MPAVGAGCRYRQIKALQHAIFYPVSCSAGASVKAMYIKGFQAFFIAKIENKQISVKAIRHKGL